MYCWTTAVPTGRWTVLGVHSSKRCSTSRREALVPAGPALAPSPVASHRGAHPALGDFPAQLPSSPDPPARSGEPGAGCPGDHGPDLVRDTHRKERLPTHIEPSTLDWTCLRDDTDLRAKRGEHPELRPGVPEGLLGRYLKEGRGDPLRGRPHGEGRRRLSVCARAGTNYRSVDRFRHDCCPAGGDRAAGCGMLGSSAMGHTLRTGAPGTDGDAGECPGPWPSKAASMDVRRLLQSPHDHVTYSGHKGGVRLRWRRPATRRTPRSSSPTWM